MVTIIVAAHGESAPALLKTAGMILGNFENVHPVTFLPGQGPEDLVEEYTRIVEASDAEETLLLVDLFGGSPYNAGAQFAATREGVDVVSGVNVPMLIEVISGAGRKNATLKSLVAKHTRRAPRVFAPSRKRTSPQPLSLPRRSPQRPRRSKFRLLSRFPAAPWTLSSPASTPA